MQGECMLITLKQFHYPSLKTFDSIQLYITPSQLHIENIAFLKSFWQKQVIQSPDSDIYLKMASNVNWPQWQGVIFLRNYF
jgi:hypothetical protein